MYTLHVIIKNGFLIAYFVNMRQPFSTQIIQDSDGKPAFTKIHGGLITHINYTIKKIEDCQDTDEINVKHKNMIDVEIKLFKQATRVLIDDVINHFRYRKNRCCC